MAKHRLQNGAHPLASAVALMTFDGTTHETYLLRLTLRTDGAILRQVKGDRKGATWSGPSTVSKIDLPPALLDDRERAQRWVLKIATALYGRAALSIDPMAVPVPR